MTARIPKPFPLYELTLVVALILIAWVALRLYEIKPEADENRKQYQELRKEFLQIADFVDANINELNATLTQYLQTKDGATLQNFQLKSAEWQQWTDKTRRRWSQVTESPAEMPFSGPSSSATSTNQPPQIPSQLMPLLARIGAQFTNYQSAAAYLINNAGGPLLRERVALHKRDLQRSRSHLLTLAQEARSLGDLTQWFLEAPKRPLDEFWGRFRNLRIALLPALVVLSFVLMWGIYRGQLTRTFRIIQQHKQQHVQQQANVDKLAHFRRLAQELAHEIKQPLTAMGARVYTLQKLLPPGSESLKDAAVIRSEIKRLDQIVRDFLALARPTEPTLVAVAAEGTLREIQQLMRPQIGDEAIALNCECEEDVQLVVDAGQLKQVLINLVKNAAECLNGRGTITLRASKTSRELRGAVTDVAVIEVADTGPGIPPEVQKRIFDPFFSTKSDGTGLGLAIASEIVDKHHGRLEFDTAPGQGTVFRIVLPASRNQHPA